MRRRLEVSMYVDGMPFDGSTLEKSSLGGSETAGAYMARELAARGHGVRIFTNCPSPGVYGAGEQYERKEDFGDYVLQVPHDVAIVQRIPSMMEGRLASKLNILWCHDLGHGRIADQYKGALFNTDAIFTVSEFHKRQMIAAMDLPEEALHATRNGIDLDLINSVEVGERDPKMIVYAARPERGLDILLADVMPKILAAEPEATLVIAGYNNPVPHMEPFYNRCREVASAFGDRVQFAGSLNKENLYRLYKTASAYVYPTPGTQAPDFREVSCISAMEAMACGLPFVSSAYGALPETLDNYSASLYGLVDDRPDVAQIARSVIEILGSPDLRDRMGQSGRERAASLSWSALAEDWENKFFEMFEERNDDPVRSALHLRKRSDLMAAKEIAETKIPPSHPVAGLLARETAFAANRSTLANHYRDTSHSYWADLEKIEADPETATKFRDIPNTRFISISRALEAHGAKRILDFASSAGHFSIYHTLRTGALMTCVDIDPEAARWCERYSEREGVEPGAIRFLVGDRDIDLHEEAPFDALVLGEILEHVPDPEALVTILEGWVKPGGLVVVTTPFGPWEFMADDWSTIKYHLHEIDLASLRDILGERKDLLITPIGAGSANKASGDALGTYVATYIRTTDAPPARPIDMVRKTTIINPRETLAVNMIAGPNAENTMRWALNSVAPIADEIIIADTGLSEAGRAIADDFGATVVEAPSPLVEGFEVPRNVALDASSSDWILWIDTDEHLLGGPNIVKHLRRNTWDAYAIPQVHFAVDGKIDPDYPTRVFRRTRTSNGKEFRFYGIIHEHPELGRLNAGPGRYAQIGGAYIAHLGYLHETGRMGRFARNRGLLARDCEVYPDRIMQKHLVMRDRVIEWSLMMAVNGGNVTPQIRAMAREVCELFREHFLGKPHLQPNMTTLENYTKAMNVLGLGIDCVLDIRASRDSVGGLGQSDQPGSGMVVKFLNAEEWKTEVNGRIDTATSNLTSPDW
jgi:glycosyltransferase involved in cell wall biosynthesis/2-polyprenyl-3-methyl-5-hydroxy-6-metoxy-1,4-benzoquinol methylase